MFLNKTSFLKSKLKSAYATRVSNAQLRNNCAKPALSLADLSVIKNSSYCMPQQEIVLEGQNYLPASLW